MRRYTASYTSCATRAAVAARRDGARRRSSASKTEIRWRSSDWDGDGDLDVISGDFRDNWTFFENVGTRTEPAYTSGRLLQGSDGKRLHADLCITAPFAHDWDHDGRLDFLSGEEDGRLGFYRNTGKVANGMPVFDQPSYVRAARDYVHFGVLCTPWTADFDGDGDLDIIAGDSAGHVAFIENLSGPGVAEPKWEEPKCLPCERSGAEPIPRTQGTYPVFEYAMARSRALPRPSGAKHAYLPPTGTATASSTSCSTTSGARSSFSAT